MKRTSILIDGTSYAMTGACDLDVLKTAVIDAAHAGGDFVAVNLSDTMAMDVFVTASPSILFMSEDVEDQDMEQDAGSDMAMPDFEDYLR